MYECVCRPVLKKNGSTTYEQSLSVCPCSFLFLRRRDARQNDIRQNDTQLNGFDFDTQHRNDARHYNTQRNVLSYSFVTPNVVVLNVVMSSVAAPSVVAPFVPAGRQSFGGRVPSCVASLH
jgi:hypothetical protein